MTQPFSDLLLAGCETWLCGRLDWFVSRTEAVLFSPSALRDYAKLGVVLAITILLEVAARKDWRVRYGSRNFRIDLLYYVFYYSGLYHVLVFAWIYRSLESLVASYAPVLQMNLLAGLPPWAQIVALIVAADFLGYWNHRIKHANRYLWAFHKIHHSQTILTAVTNYRFHIVDETFLRVWLFIPFQILGPGIEMWLWADFIMAWILLAQHSDWHWSYGRLGRVFVSPLFHRRHHSTDERLQNRNFAMLFSFWDDAFGTAERNAPYPTSLGLIGNPVPETVLGQIIHPFVEIIREIRSPPQTAAGLVHPTRNPGK